MINIDDLNQVTAFEPDDQPHIIINRETCRSCSQHHCVTACPAKCYTFDVASGRLDVAWENCLECGTCLVVCERKALDWAYPRGGFGVRYRMS